MDAKRKSTAQSNSSTTDKKEQNSKAAKMSDQLGTDLKNKVKQKAEEKQQEQVQIAGNIKNALGNAIAKTVEDKKDKKGQPKVVKENTLETCYGKLSDEQVEEFMIQRDLLYVNNRKDYKKDASLGALEKQFECVVCNRLPIYQQSCNKCGERICQKCEQELKEVNGIRKCPSAKCKTQKVEIEMQPLDATSDWSKILEMIKQPHSCQLPKKEEEGGKKGGKDKDKQEAKDTKEYTIMDLHAHIEEKCVLNRTCLLCSKQFENTEKYRHHIQHNCELVTLPCKVCSKSFQRKEFFNYEAHTCTTQNLNKIDFEIASQESKILENTNQIYLLKSNYCLLHQVPIELHTNRSQCYGCQLSVSTYKCKDQPCSIVNLCGKCMLTKNIENVEPKEEGEDEESVNKAQQF